jgi:predicted nucleic acid-binding protein
MKALFDLNVIIDVTDCRESFYYDSLAVFKLAAEGKIEGIVGAGSIADLYYIVRKSRKDAGQAMDAIHDTLEVLTAVDTKAVDILSAMAFGFDDFEDAVTAAVAQREGADYIISRNGVDFTNSPVPAITPAAFLQI